MRTLTSRWLNAALLGACVVAAGLTPAVAAEPTSAAPAWSNPFYAYCVGIGTDPESATLQAQQRLAPALAKCGYAGMAHVGLNGVPEMLQALESQGQKLLAAYTPLNVDPGDPGYDPKLREVILQLKGHGTLVWLVINSKQYKPSSTEGDPRAVELLRQLADLAAQSGVAISLYPHRGAYAERMEDVVRLAKQVARPNVGVTFTYCHFLAVDDDQHLDRVLELARPYLTMVTINGTSGYDPKNRAGWIQVLGEGSYDLSPVLRKLRQLDYRGPIGIIAYGIKGDHEDILRRSMQAWKDLAARAVAGP